MVPRIRNARTTEAADLVALINKAFEVESFFLDGDRIDLEKVNSLLGSGTFLVCDREGDGIIGCVYLEQIKNRMYLGLLSIDPNLQRRGLGSELLAAAEDFCRTMGCIFLDLRIVNLREELKEFYRSHGFVETGTAPFPENVSTRLPCHFILMSKEVGAGASMLME